jgi:hypothetical protein
MPDPAEPVRCVGNKISAYEGNRKISGIDQQLIPFRQGGFGLQGRTNILDQEK